MKSIAFDSNIFFLFGIGRKQTYLDDEGYSRYKYSDKLVHRQNAYKYIYLPNRSEYSLSFGKYQVHHIDGNKRNNHSDNLQIVTQDEHEQIHRVGKYTPNIIWRILRWVLK